VLNGGTTAWGLNGNADFGGAFKVAASSMMSGDRWNSTNDSLEFTAAATLTVTNRAGVADPWAHTFKSVTVTESGTLNLATRGGALTVSMHDTAVRIGATLTKAGTQTLKVLGPIGARLRGSAEVLTATNFTLLAHSSGTLDYTASAFLSPAGGLWASPALVDNMSLTVTVANAKGDLVARGVLSFPAEDGGHAALRNLAAGTAYTLHLDLAGGDANKAAVQAEMRTNPLWATVGDSTEGGYEVAAVFTPTRDGDFYFAWDNSAAGRLRDDLVGLKLTSPPAATMFFIR
jgi:hypothetical protein